MEIIGFIIGCVIAIVLASRRKQPQKLQAVTRKYPKLAQPSSTPRNTTHTMPQFPASPPSMEKPQHIIEEIVPLKLSIHRPPAQKNRDIENICNKTNKRFKTNLHQMTCTCDDFQNSHSLYAISDIRRMCKHLNQAYKAEMNLDGLDVFVKAIIGGGHGVKVNFLYLYDQNDVNSDETILLTFDKDNEWWDIFVHESQNVLRYGFNILSSRWSNNQHPSAIEAGIEKAIDSILTSGLYQIDKDLLKIRDIVSKVNTNQQLRNLQKRLERAEQKYGFDSTAAQLKRYEILSQAWDVAEDKIFYREQDAYKDDD